MPVTMTEADMFAYNLLASVREEFYKDLDEAKVSFGVWMFHSADGDGDGVKPPAIMHHGFAVSAKAVVNSYEKRVQGLPDATIKLDAVEWDEMTDEQKRAVLDEMLYSFELCTDDEGKPLKDLHDRPRLKIRKADYRLQGFRLIAERHASAAPEVIAAKAWADQYGQLMFGWTTPPAGPEAMAEASALAGKGKKAAPVDASEYETAMREYEAMWRKQPIGELSPPLKPGKLKALAAVEPPILTLGDMADFSKQHGDWWGKDIKGFGAKGQEQLGVATDRYWAARQPPEKPKEEVVDVPAIKDPPIRPIGDFENEFSTGYLVNTCRPGLLAKLTAGEVCEVSAVMVNDQLYVVTLAPTSHPSDVYALRPLYDVEEGVALPEPHREDQYVGRLVTCDGEGKWIGPRSEMLLVRDAEATAPATATATAGEARNAPPQSRSGRR